MEEGAIHLQLLEGVEEAKEAEGLSLKFALDKDGPSSTTKVSLRVLIVPTTAESSKGCVCVYNNAYFSITAIGDEAESRNMILQDQRDNNFFDVEPLPPTYTDFQAIDGKNILYFDVDTGLPVRPEDEKSQGQRCLTGRSGWGPDELCSVGQFTFASMEGIFRGSDFIDYPPGQYRVDVVFRSDMDSYINDITGQEVSIPNVIKGEWSASTTFQLSH